MDDMIKKSNNGNLPKEDKNWWKPAVEIFSQISGWIVAPIVVALIVGKKLDAHFNTKPWFFLGLAAFGFFITTFGIFRVISKYIERIKELGEVKKIDKI